jgi:hypothetical protein
MKTHEVIETDDRYATNLTSVEIYAVKYPNGEATFAMQLANDLAIATAVPDGEDSAGRQKIRMMTPDEVTERACQIAAKMFAQFDKCGWLMDLPLPKKRDEK